MCAIASAIQSARSSASISAKWWIRYIVIQLKDHSTYPKAGRVDEERHPEAPVHLEELVDVRAEVTGEVAEQHDAPLARDGGEHEQREEEEKRGIVCVALEEPPRDNPHVYVGREEAGDFPTVSRPKAGGARARATERVAKFRKRVLRDPRSLPRGEKSFSVRRWTLLAEKRATFDEPRRCQAKTPPALRRRQRRSARRGRPGARCWRLAVEQRMTPSRKARINDDQRDEREHHRASQIRARG